VEEPRSASRGGAEREPAQPVLRTLGAYRQGFAAAPAQPTIRERIFALWPKQPAWQMGVSFALLVMVWASVMEFVRTSSRSRRTTTSLVRNSRSSAGR